MASVELGRGSQTAPRASREPFGDSWTGCAAPRRTTSPGTTCETFDLRRRCALYLTYYRYGDTRKRGMAMLAFKAAYQAAGFEPSGRSCRTTCRWCWTSPRCTRAARSCSARTAADLELLLRALRDAADAYADVVEAVCAQLPALRRQIGAGAESLGVRTAQEEVGLEPFAPPEVPDRNGRPDEQHQRLAGLRVGRAALPGARHLRRRPHLAMAVRPVRLDQPLHPAARNAACSNGASPASSTTAPLPPSAGM